jgi:acyl-coenzyme A thioesterase PaaI-like protein
MGDGVSTEASAVEGTSIEWPSAADTLHPTCFVCASDNARGLRVRFTSGHNGDGSTAEFECRPCFEGYPGVIHGGIVCTLLDAAMTHCLLQAGRSGRTGRLSVRFEQAVVARGAARVSARVIRSRGRRVELAATLTQGGATKATASGVFMLDV